MSLIGFVLAALNALLLLPLLPFLAAIWLYDRLTGTTEVETGTTA